MSFEPDNKDADRSVEQQNEEIISLLKAILMALEIVTGTENLIDEIEE